MYVTSNDPFVPHRGKEADIADLTKVPYKDGAVYFAYDTNKIFFDAKKERHVIQSGSDVTFYVGDDASPKDNTTEGGYWELQKQWIEAANIKTGDVILNSDNKFYRVIEDVLETDTIVKCVLIAGGGGGDSMTRRLSISAPSAADTWPSAAAKGYDISGTFTVVSSFKEDTFANLQISISHEELLNPIVIDRTVDLGVPTKIDLKSSNFEKKGKYTITMVAYIDEDDRKGKLVGTVDILDLKLTAKNWNPLKRYGEAWSDVAFYWEIADKGYDIPTTIRYYLDDQDLASQDGTGLTSSSYSFHDEFLSVGHGNHKFSVAAYVTINGAVIKLNQLDYDIMWLQENNYTPIILSSYTNTQELNYSIINIPYMVFTPYAETGSSVVKFAINGEEISTGALTVPFDEQREAVWEIAEYNIGMNAFTITSGVTSRTFEVEVVVDSNRNLDAIEGADCLVKLQSFGRSNRESASRRQQWSYTPPNGSTVEAELTGFNWYSNGWIRDAENHVALRLNNGARVKIPLNVLNTGVARNLTFEFEFQIRNALSYSKLIYLTEGKDETGNDIVIKHVSTDSDVVCQYYKNDVGLAIGTQDAYFKSQNKIVSVAYTDNSRVKISMVVSNSKKEKLIYIYINGVLTGIEEFTDDDSFQADAQYIEFNSDYCDIDIYSIRVYNMALDYGDIVQNWIGDAPDLNEKLARFDRNDIFVKDANDRVTVDYTKCRTKALELAERKLAGEDIDTIPPIMVIKSFSKDILGGDSKVELLPFKKGDKKIVGIRYLDPLNPAKNFHCQNVELDVQGTSSQGYPRRNYKAKTKEKSADLTTNGKLPYHFQHWDGREVTKDVYDGTDVKKGKYDLGHGIAENVFCLKADYMESSSSHNTGLANYIGDRFSDQFSSVWDFRHPLVRTGDMTSCRTTIYGFPILVFHEEAYPDKEGNPIITFIGKYNFNIDKGATDSFGFTQEFKHPFIDTARDFDEDTYEYLEGTHEATYCDIAECWELKNNQAGRATFQQLQFGDKPTDDPAQYLDAEGKLSVLSDFEARYHYTDFDTDDIYEANASDLPKANAQILGYMGNLIKLCEWINSTDTSSTRWADPNNQVPDALPAPVYYTTLDSEYNASKNYYVNKGDETPAVITFTMVATVDKIGEANPAAIDQAKFLAKLKEVLETEEAESLIGGYTFSKQGALWYYNNEQVNMSDWGLTISLMSAEAIDVTVNQVNDWKNTYFEKHTTDSNDYRLGKFKDEFTLHFDKSYSIFYSVLTEFLLMYDSRAKNMMIASFGPEKEGGEYIWYPIFYDMDTQLGINNSGVVYWDYDTNATPDKGELDANGEQKAPIFSGASSVLWNNVSTCFPEDIKACYRAIREKSLNFGELCQYYDANQVDKWSEIVKNIDAFYKYIAPNVSDIGFTNIDGETDYTSQFYYCLQGDRKLSRDLFFRNRLNYMDSKWQAGSYSAGTLAVNIQMRYNANDGVKTSDSGASTAPELDANATYEIIPFLTQYLMLLYDERATKPELYDINVKKGAPMVIDPPAALKAKIESGEPQTQQLVYVYGPEYISELGDLSLKYLNEFWGGNAIRLRHLKLGSDTPGYRNSGMVDSSLKLDTGAYMADGTANPKAKTLLQTLDLSNLSGLTTSIDISGCIKLNTLKALGTRLQSIALPDGNVIKTAYLPETINAISLIEPQALTKLLETAPVPGANEEGLYVQGLTDKLDEVVSPDDTEIKTRISRFTFENTKLKYGTYRILKRLFDIKNAMWPRATLEDGYRKTLAMSMLGIDWSPYTKVESDAKYDSTKKYYYLNDWMTYSQYEYSSATWEAYVSQIGLYTKEDEDSIVPDLAIIDKFLEQYTDSSVSISDQYFRGTAETGLTKVLPPMTGNIHVNNSADNPLDEAKLVNYYGANYPDLQITANYVTQGYRAKFVEVSADGKTTKTYATMKIGKDAPDKPSVAFPTGLDLPSRLHYDFLGWSKPERTEAIKAAGSIGTLDDVQDLSELTLDKNYEFCAVFAVHSYDVTLFNHDGSTIKIVKTASGKNIEVPPLIPWRDDSDLGLTQCWKFLGYGYNDGSNNVVDLSTVTVYRDLSYYAKYEQTSVYDNVLPQDAIIYRYGQDEAPKGYSIGLNSDYEIQGKICLPTKIIVEGKQVPVEAIWSNPQNSTNDMMDGLAVGRNGLGGNNRITHIFFEGGNDNTCTVKTVGAIACYAMKNLKHFEFPDSLTTVRINAFNSCERLSFNSTNNIDDFWQNCFANCNIYGEHLELQIKGNLNSLRQYAFSYAGWKTITIGATDDPCPLTDATNINGLGTGFAAFGGYVWANTGRELQNFILYSTYFTSPDQLMFLFEIGQNTVNVSLG